MEKSKISVILATYNNEAYIKGSIESVLNQTYQNFELIIIDDASNDLTSEIISKIKNKKIKYIRNKKNLGLVKCLNKGLEIAKGEFIARIDGDDVAVRNRFKKQLDFLKARKDIKAVGTFAQEIDEQGNKGKIIKFPKNSREIRKVIPQYIPFLHPTLMFRRSVFEEIGNYDERFKYAQDHDLMLRITGKFKTANIPQVLLLYRKHAKSISFERMSEQLKLAFFARLKALKNGDIKFWQSIYLIKPAVSLLIPVAFKKLFLKLK